MYLQPQRKFHVEADFPNDVIIDVTCSPELCRAIEVMPYWSDAIYFDGWTHINCVLSPLYDKATVVQWLNDWLTEQTSDVELGSNWDVLDDESEANDG